MFLLYNNILCTHVKHLYLCDRDVWSMTRKETLFMKEIGLIMFGMDLALEAILQEICIKECG